MKPGDIVVVHDESYPRAFWKLARVKELVIGKDGLQQRAVFVKTPMKGRSTDYTSATSAGDSPPGDLRKSTPADEVQDSNSKEATSPCNVAEPTPCHRQQRASAARARHRMKDWSEFLLEGGAYLTTSSLSGQGGEDVTPNIII